MVSKGVGRKEGGHGDIGGYRGQAWNHADALAAIPGALWLPSDSHERIDPSSRCGIGNTQQLG
jgi:hypothetical protein